MYFYDWGFVLLRSLFYCRITSFKLIDDVVTTYKSRLGYLWRNHRRGVMHSHSNILFIKYNIKILFHPFLINRDVFFGTEFKNNVLSG